tara:strand:- start:100 stop:621 length:522 start_codon:yes stop_codon:yes gene_type:complete
MNKMFREKFLFNFLKYKQKYSHEIIKYNSNNKVTLLDQINIEILELDQKISENSKSLVEAQIVKLRSIFSKSNNFIEKLSKNIYKSKLDESINWHQNQLKELSLKRRELEIKLEKIQGIFWLNWIKRLLRIIFIGFFIFLSLFIFLSGFMIIIYLMPLFLFILLGYLISKKRY